MAFPGPSKPSRAVPYGRAAPASPPKAAAQTGATIMSGKPHIMARAPGRLGHNRGIAAVNMHTKATDSNAPKSNKNKGQSA